MLESCLGGIHYLWQGDGGNLKLVCTKNLIVKSAQNHIMDAP